MSDHAATTLASWKKWLAEDKAVITALLLLGFVVVLIGNGISGLSSNTPPVAGGAAPDANRQAHELLTSSPGWDDASLQDGLHDPRMMFPCCHQAREATVGFAFLASVMSAARRQRRA